jgi:hypothetical protein
VGVIRISAKRLDLCALENGEEIRIVTGTTGIQVIAGHRAGDIHVGIAATRKGLLFSKEGQWATRWLNLEALEPRRMYRVEVTRSGEDMMVDFEDITPGGPASETASGGRGWDILGRLLSGRR